VFQNYALYPHMSVRDNMGFALKVARVPKAKIRERVDEAARLLELEPYLDRRPKELSGGQRQRVAMGRAIVREPQVFLMDEPLSNLDAKLRVSTRTQIAMLQRRLGVTTVYVTHDQVEAMTLGDRVAVLRDGVLQQFDVPLALYERPCNQFVAGFIGSPAMSFLTGHGHGAGVSVHGASILRPHDQPVGGDVVVGVRPEGVRVLDGDAADVGALQLRVDLVEELGADAYVYGTVAGSTERLVARVDGRRPPAVGSALSITLQPDHVHLFDTETGDRRG
jgi:multiple sugar transport system ATP-binding protein